MKFAKYKHLFEDVSDVSNYSIAYYNMLDGAKRGDIDKLEKAIKSGMDVNYVFPSGNTPLIFAIRWAHLEAINILLAAGANPNFPGGKNDPPIEIAKEYLHEDDVQKLQKRKTILQVLLYAIDHRQDDTEITPEDLD